MERKEVIWAEKYRPRKVEDCILPSYIKKLATNIMETGDIPNLLLIGSSGLGKTTLAKSICQELNLDFMMLNASIGGQESGIDALRNNIMRFASTVSIISDKRKVIIFDEADNLSAAHVQPALRNFMEEYSSLCGFILTCNYPQKLIDAIHSRCTKIDFNELIDVEKKDLMLQTFKRVSSVLTQESIEFDKDAVAHLIKEFFPDIRHILNLLQGYAQAHGKIDRGILAVYQENTFDVLIPALKEKKWNLVRDWVFKQPNIRPEVYSKLYKVLEKNVNSKSKPTLVIILNEHQDKATRVVDKGICLLAALTEVMGNCEFA